MALIRGSPRVRSRGTGAPAGYRCTLSAVNDNVNENYEKLAGLLRDRKDWRPETQEASGSGPSVSTQPGCASPRRWTGS